MIKLPAWLWTLLGGVLLGALGGGTLVFKLSPSSISLTPSPNPPLTPSSDPSLDLVNVKVLISDKKKIPLEDAEVSLAAKEGIPTKRTLADGTVIFQIPKQKLGEVRVKVVKSGYKTKELPVVFAINPNEIPVIELDEDTSSPGDSSSSPKIDWGTLNSYFDMDNDLNIQRTGGTSEGLSFAIHVTARKDFNAISFKAQPYDAFGVRTSIVPVAFSYSPQKWKKGDRSLITIGTPANISKLEIIY